MDSQPQSRITAEASDDHSAFEIELPTRICFQKSFFNAAISVFRNLQVSSRQVALTHTAREGMEDLFRPNYLRVSEVEPGDSSRYFFSQP